MKHPLDSFKNGDRVCLLTRPSGATIEAVHGASIVTRSVFGIPTNFAETATACYRAVVMSATKEPTHAD